jgi:hypothetical protein
MGKKATKAAENIFYVTRYQASQENPSLSSRENAAELLNIDRTRLARIELGTTQPYPEEVIQMSKIYNAPELCHLYCSMECPLGKCTMSKVDITSDFDRLALQVLGSFEHVTRLKSKLITIAEDGAITPDEEEDFDAVLEALERLSSSAQSLKIWAEKNIRNKKSS